MRDMAKKKVIAVDDEEVFLKMMKINLEATGQYEVEIMSDATDLVSRAKTFQPDIILLDILMPNVEGTTACEMLKKDPATQHVPVVALSALETDKDKRMMYKLGVADFFIKPIGTANLIAGIEKVLQKAHGN